MEFANNDDYNSPNEFLTSMEFISYPNEEKNVIEIIRFITQKLIDRNSKFSALNQMKPFNEQKLNYALKSDDIIQATKTFTEVLLDQTFELESELFKSSYPDSYTVSCITEELTIPTKIFNTIDSNKSVGELAGVDMAECLQWRRGALAYMYAIAYFKNAEKLDSSFSDGMTTKKWLEFLHNGIRELSTIGMIRHQIGLNSLSFDETIGGDEDTILLVKQNVFSDTHLLALAYCGELAFWASSIAPISQPQIIANFQRMARECFEKYIEVISSVKALSAWTKKRPMEYLSKLT